MRFKIHYYDCFLLTLLSIMIIGVIIIIISYCYDLFIGYYYYNYYILNTVSLSDISM
jgi:site-specific recombinase